MLEKLDGTILTQESGDELKQLLLRDINTEIITTQNFVVRNALTWVKDQLEDITAKMAGHPDLQP